MQRTYIQDALEKAEGEKVLLKGWVYDTRDLKKLRFLILKDTTGRIQVTGINSKTDEKTFVTLDNLKRESAVEVIGTIKDSNQAPGGKEILPESITIIAESADPLPIDVSDYSKTELPKRLDYRFLDLHQIKTQALFKIQSTMLQAFREYMINYEAIEAIFPSVIGSSSEGGTDLFTIKYFEKKAYLSQSCQLYKQMLACSMEKVFAILPVWRAEKHNTVRHLNESRQYDYEECFIDDKQAMKLLGEVVQHIIKTITEKNSKELETLKITLKIPKIKYLTFKETNELLEKNKIKTTPHDLTGEGEKKLGELYPDTIVFVHDWPIEGKPFYIMPSENGLSKGFDAIYQGMEIASGGQRIHLPEILIERLKAKDLNPKDFEKYIESFKYGAPPHAGWGMGVERLTMLILGYDNIREVVLFPRDRDRLTP